MFFWTRTCIRLESTLRNRLMLRAGIKINFKQSSFFFIQFDVSQYNLQETLKKLIGKNCDLLKSRKCQPSWVDFLEKTNEAIFQKEKQFWRKFLLMCQMVSICYWRNKHLKFVHIRVAFPVLVFFVVRFI